MVVESSIVTQFALAKYSCMLGTAAKTHTEQTCAWQSSAKATLHQMTLENDSYKAYHLRKMHWPHPEIEELG